MAVAVALLVASSSLPSPLLPRFQPTPIRHVVVIMEENHTFDNLFGTFPGANGVANDPAWAKSRVFAMTSESRDLCHSVACSVAYYDGGRMDGWTVPDSFGTYPESSISYFWQLAKNYTLMDNYFSGFMGPSLPNHIVAIAGDVYNHTTDQRVIEGTMLPVTIFDRLNQAGYSWAYFTGYCCELSGFNPLPLAASKLVPGPISAFPEFLATKGLPAVTYLMPPSDQQSGHPPYNVTESQDWVRQAIGAIQASPYWGSTAILLTWDEGGGYYDHVVPPSEALGFRVPMIIVSPYAKAGFVDHAMASHASIPAFIEEVFGLKCMAADCHSSNMTGAFDFGRPALVVPALGGSRLAAGAAYPPTFPVLSFRPGLVSWPLGPSPVGPPGPLRA